MERSLPNDLPISRSSSPPADHPRIDPGRSAARESMIWIATSQILRRSLNRGEIETVNNGVNPSAIADPDGNTITFIGNFGITH